MVRVPCLQFRAFDLRFFQSVSILLLKEGTEQAKGKRQILSNIPACQVDANAVRTTLGSRVMDKLIHDNNGAGTYLIPRFVRRLCFSGEATIWNNGATI